MVQAADLLSAIHNSLHHGIQAQNDTTKGGKCLFCSYSSFTLSHPEGIYSVWFVQKFHLIQSVWTLECFASYTYKMFMPPSFNIFSRMKTVEYFTIFALSMYPIWWPCYGVSSASFFFFFKIFRERGKEGERERNIRCMKDTSISCLSHTPSWGPGL